MTKEIVLPEVPKQSIARRIRERILPTDRTLDLLKRQVFAKVLNELRVTEPEVLNGSFERRKYSLDLSNGSKRYSAELGMVEFETGLQSVGLRISEVVPKDAPVCSFNVRLSKALSENYWRESQHLLKLSGEENYADGDSSDKAPRIYSRREMVNFLKGVLSANVFKQLESDN